MLIKGDVQVSRQRVGLFVLVAAGYALQTGLFLIYLFLSNGLLPVHTRAHTQLCYCCFSGPLTLMHLPHIGGKIMVCIERIKTN